MRERIANTVLTGRAPRVVRPNNFRRLASTRRLALRHRPADPATSPKLVGIVVFDRVSSVDLMGPAEIFSQPTVLTAGGRRRPCYHIVAMGIGKGTCMTDSGIALKPQVSIQKAPVLDTVIIPGGDGIRNPKVNREIVHWLSVAAPAARRIAALGTGIYPLAATGLVDERQVATHSRLGDDVASRFPKLRVNSTGLFLKDGSFFTCAGGIASIDFCLALVEEDYGRQLALAVARDLVVQVKRSGDEDQYSQLLHFQIQSSDRFA